MICASANGLADAFRVPLWGRRADETPPSWLITLMQAGTVAINPTTGGLTYRDESCQAGDYILLHEDGHIEFCTASEFMNTFTLLDDRLAA